MFSTLSFVFVITLLAKGCDCQPLAPVCGGSAGLRPWMASVNYNNVTMCVGTLVSDRLVMTSVSCIARFMGRNGWSVTLYAVQRNCSRVTANVTKAFTDSGVALLQLSDQFYDNAKLELDPFSSTFGPGTQCSVIGWNSTDFTSNLHFQEFQTTIVNCDPSNSSGINVCTPFLDVQQDDDGSPLVCRMGDRWVQTGILSIRPGSENNTYSNSTVFIQTSPFIYFVMNTIYDVPTILNGAESFSPLSLTYILLFSLPAILQAFY